MLLDPRIDEALILASRAHAEQVRKGTDIPYIAHPACVALILERAGFDTEVVIAGILHDVVEDTDLEIGDIASRFGERVAELVSRASEDKSQSWRARKLRQIDEARHASPELKAIKAADKLHNCWSILRDLESGADVFDRFKAGREETLWYYSEIAASIAHGWDHPIAGELATMVERLVNAAGDDGS
jgi:(p)ppGpp synthase/HD superfamily hydrolase